jgi:diaminohydroxyphosphoribosylaminopyrimidine deaminase / 5-amino-6-(5-phosphoribosylamino)uracil reductase
MSDRSRDAEFMREALAAAAEGAGLASPNPLVGSVVVRDGRIVGRGFHVYANRKHGEVVALEDAGELARGSTIYVNLEPCSHHGRTPPCVDALVGAGVSRVVASMQDPAPYVDGRGFARLREAGIEVDVGLESDPARRLNEQYLRAIVSGRPFVLVKSAATLDGRVATRRGASEWITGAEARAASQELRRVYDAILVGVNTVVADDPELTYRAGGPKRLPLLRAVLDPRLRTPTASRLVATAAESPLVLFTRRESATSDTARALVDRGVEIVGVDEERAGRLDVAQVLEDLCRRHVNGVIVEGGPETSAVFVERGLVDKVTLYLSPRLLGGRASVGLLGGDDRRSLADALSLRDVEVRRLGEDLEVTGYPRGKDEG